MRVTSVVLSAIALGACSPRVAPTPAPSCCDRATFRDALAVVERHRNPAITERRFTHATLWESLAPTLRSPAFRVDTIGRSILGRDIRAVSFGRGPTRVLLWSQMHGDEATATMSLSDLLRFFADTLQHPLRERLARDLTVVMVPMLNPDGAELFQRQNAIGIDVNRDARRLVTPEARALKALRDRVQPHFAFNLHDQSARTRAGRNGPASGIALLPPAYDAAKSYNDTRTRARLVAATLAAMFSGEIPGRVARYDDTFNPRAFGDLMQTWGASTVLIESGALPDDPQKQRLRALNAAAILLILDAIATRAYEGSDPEWYEGLPFNAGGATDLLVRGGQLVLPGIAPMPVDVAINYDDAVARTGGRVRDVGDLADVVAIDTLDVQGLFLFPDSSAVTVTPAGPVLRIDTPASFEVRRGSSTGSELVRRIGHR